MELTPICPPVAACKICGTQARLLGYVDFHKNCEEARRKVLEFSGIPIPYYVCSACDFLFTTAFDEFAAEDFSRHIYNGQYALVDPDYREVRPKANADMIARTFPAGQQLRILDYGGGNGLLANRLREKGYATVDAYDPFVPEHAARPEGKYDLVLSFEVAEHAHKPLEAFRDMVGFMETRGMLIFSTLVRTPDVVGQGLGWWYVGPRNGHVSLYGARTLGHVANLLGMVHAASGPGLHLFRRKVPDFAKHLFAKA